jgi:hypothetical protein
MFAPSKCDAEREHADREVAEFFAVADAQFRHRSRVEARAEACDPHIGAVENDILRRASDRIRSENGPIARHLEETLAVAAEHDPNVRSVISHTDGRAGPKRKGLDGEGVRVRCSRVDAGNEKAAERERKHG